MTKPKHSKASTFLMDDYQSEHLMEDMRQEFVDEPSLYSSSTSNTGSESIEKHMMDVGKTTRRTIGAALMVVVMGAIAASSFLYMGITAEKEDNEERFERRARDMAKEVDGAWDDYESAASWVHSACRNWRTDNFSYPDFEAVYHYLRDGGLDFFAIDWIPNVTHAERQEIEKTQGAYWKDNIEGAEGYTGFMGQEPDPDNPGELVYTNRSKQDFYFPIYFAEPKNTTASIIHYDLYSPPWERPAIDKALETYEPALTGRFVLAQHTEEDGYSVLLYHPGAPLPSSFHMERHDLATIIMNINLFLQRAARFQSEPMSVYLYDKTLTAIDGAEPEFLGGVTIQVELGGGKQVLVLKETEYDVLQEARLYYEEDTAVGARIWTTVVVAVDGTYENDLTFVFLSGVLIFGASVLLAVWMLHNMRRSIHLHKVITKAAAEASIVSNLFPANIRERMIQDAEAKNNARLSMKRDVFRSDGKGGENRLSQHRLDKLLTSEGLFGSKPIAELHPYTTCMIADLAGFTSWASVREPSQVFTLLEIIYHAWDSIAQRRRVYKVETVGDSYVAVAGLPEERDDHAVVMARFAFDCLQRFRSLVKALEKTLGPDTGDLGARCGLHSGQCVAGVLRGDKGRFQLFGDTVNMAARMESTGVRNKIHCSQETADLLTEAGHSSWLIPREEEVIVKGKGKIKTFFVSIGGGSQKSGTSSTDHIHEIGGCTESKTERLIEWNVEVLCSLLRSIVARRESQHKRRQKGQRVGAVSTSDMVLDEVVEIITMPKYNGNSIKKQVDPDTIVLGTEVVDQLTSLVRRIGNTYRSNPFHNFDHASHVTMSVIKMMGRIVAPKGIAKKDHKGGSKTVDTDAVLHDHTFGITSDPLTQFACAFSALIHDVDHQGIPNTVLVQEGSPLAAKYQNKSVAEQNSVDLAWGFLLEPEYAELRSTICCDDEEFARFRSLVVNSVMATDIMDKELGAARKARWNRAFDTEGFDDPLEATEDSHQLNNRKATIVIEHLIQASDVSHTMQHWHVYAKWNQRLFTELYKAYKEGRLEKDPSEGWYRGEMGFFDFYIIPLAKKLFTCGVFGVSSDEFLNYALINRKEWEQKGEEMVQQYLKDYYEKFGGDVEEKFGEDDDKYFL